MIGRSSPTTGPASPTSGPVRGAGQGGGGLVLALAFLAGQACACTGPRGVSDKRPPARDCPALLPEAGGQSPGAQLVRSLGRSDHFLFGAGSDLVGVDGDALAWGLSAPVDVHYLYLVGLPDTDAGWPDWNPDGTYIDRHMVVAQEQCALPMFTLYSMAVDGENNMEVLQDEVYMERWWDGLELALERMEAVGGPAILHVEPDFWGFAQKATPSGKPEDLPVLVGSLVPACEDLGDSLAAMGQCLYRRGESLAPEVRIALHASQWAAPTGAETGAFLQSITGAKAPLLVVETLDRDAGCFEVGATDCTRTDGPWYWDETNQSSPSFADHLAWATELHVQTGKPLLWWQMPLGVASDEPGGEPHAYRDNRVRYLFAHPDEFVAAGGIGAVFGPGAPNQTTLATDGGQFEAAWTRYLDSPVPLP